MSEPHAYLLMSPQVRLRCPASSHGDIGWGVMSALCDEGGISLTHKPESLMFIAVSNEVKRGDGVYLPLFWDKAKK